MDTLFFKKLLTTNTDIITNDGVIKYAPNIVILSEMPKWECWKTSESGLHNYYIFRPSGTVAGYVRKSGMLVIKKRSTHVEQCMATGWTMEKMLRFVYLKMQKPKG